MELVKNFNAFIWNYIAIFMLGAGIYLTIKTKFAQLTMLPEMFKLVTKGISKKVNGISGFQAFCVSLASRVGVGNIAGVAIAIVTGGPGAIFWMWVTAFFCCSTSFVECTLAQIYKIPNKDGTFYGGPAYYMKNALKQPILAYIFSILMCLMFCMVYSVQANTITISTETTFGINRLAMTIFLCIVTALTVFGQMKGVAKISEKMVPIMAFMYIISAIIVSVMNFDKIPQVIYLIFHDAFSPKAVLGGGIGIAIMTGVRRGIFSNEAGVGSVPNAAATADAAHPVQQGFIQSFGVYVATFFVCGATAFIILLTGKYNLGSAPTGIELAQVSLGACFGNIATQLLSIIIFLFAFSTIIGNYYYAEIIIAFFKHDNNKFYMNIFRVIVVITVFIGGLQDLSLVWESTDLIMGFLCITNTYAILRLSKYSFEVLNDYIEQKKAGIEEPIFDSSKISNNEGIFSWKK